MLAHELMSTDACMLRCCRDTRRLVLEPVERMVERVQEMADDPLSQVCGLAALCCTQQLQPLHSAQHAH